ncbi:MAG: hypothetical protein JO086_12330 [Acidimicrobiia bacterium]|nr:hypothetical protein [Acidimicrobiia bacterium]
MKVVAVFAAVAALGAGAGCTARSDAASGVVNIEIHHSRFVPAAVSVGSRQTVRFVVRNTDPIDHEFIVGDQATQDRHEHGADDHHDGSVPGEISVPAGTTVTTTYYVDRRRQLLYGCHLPGHWAYGMRGVIRVSS